MHTVSKPRLAAFATSLLIPLTVADRFSSFGNSLFTNSNKRFKV